MNIASLDNCKRLYELSGWETEDWYDLDLDSVPEEYFATTEDMVDGNDYVPAYDAGYLLRKLPTNHPDAKNRDQYRITVEFTPDGWKAFYSFSSMVMREYADTPEDALCLLAIKLFEEGILTNEN